VQIVGACEPPGEQRGIPRVQVRLARERGIQRLQLLGRLHQQRRGVAARAGGERNLPAQQVGAGLLEVIQRPAIAMLSNSAAASSAPACRLACAAARATGETVRKHTVDTREALTVQEAQAARLAAETHTNPEIGAQLFISPRTAEYHLHKVFSNFGISSRRQIRHCLA
jgi:DNA-binding CsgD family transcriptional regulator